MPRMGTERRHNAPIVPFRQHFAVSMLRVPGGKHRKWVVCTQARIVTPYYRPDETAGRKQFKVWPS